MEESEDGQSGMEKWAAFQPDLAEYAEVGPEPVRIHDEVGGVDVDLALPVSDELHPLVADGHQPRCHDAGQWASASGSTTGGRTDHGKSIQRSVCFHA